MATDGHGLRDLIIRHGWTRMDTVFCPRKFRVFRGHPCQNKERKMENEFEVTVRQTLVKTTSVFTDAVHECVERDYDATTGRYEYASSVEPDCDLEELFAEQQRSPLEIIRCCEQICKELLSEGRRRCAKVDLADLRIDCEYWEEERG